MGTGSPMPATGDDLFSLALALLDEGGSPEAAVERLVAAAGSSVTTLLAAEARAQALARVLPFDRHVAELDGLLRRAAAAARAGRPPAQSAAPSLPEVGVDLAALAADLDRLRQSAGV